MSVRLGSSGRRGHGPWDADELPLFCSMNVQGDYEPVDATGFININSLR